MRVRSMLLAAALAGGVIFAYPASADGDKKSGRYRIVLMNNSVVEGDLQEVDGGYKIKNKYGMIITLRKGEIRRMEKLGPSKDAAAVGDGSENPLDDRIGKISEEDILRILGDDEIDEADVESAETDLSPLPTDQASLAEMRRIAGSAANVWETDHFILLYTSDRKMARKLGSRLESVYEWCHKFMKMMDLQPIRPDYKLEIYFFNTHDEFSAYGNNQGGIPDWAAGFYIRTNNRSAFYDLNDEPRMVAFRERLEKPGIHWRTERYYKNRMGRLNQWLNVSVIQHEAAHHIHFNVGIFSKRGDYPRFLTEGLAQMFELPPGRRGGGLGTTNHSRLAELNRRYPRNRRKAMIPTKQFVVDDATGWPAAYPQAWGLTHYLWKKKRPEFARYMKNMAQREDDVTLTATQRQQEFEDIFGPADELHKKFVDYIFSVQFRRSALDF